MDWGYGSERLNLSVYLWLFPSISPFRFMYVYVSVLYRSMSLFFGGETLLHFLEGQYLSRQNYSSGSAGIDTRLNNLMPKHLQKRLLCCCVPINQWNVALQMPNSKAHIIAIQQRVPFIRQRSKGVLNIALDGECHFEDEVAFFSHILPEE